MVAQAQAAPCDLVDGHPGKVVTVVDGDTLELEDGRIVNGFMCEAAVLPTATDISEFGGWRAYVSRKQAD